MQLLPQLLPSCSPATGLSSDQGSRRRVRGVPPKRPSRAMQPTSSRLPAPPTLVPPTLAPPTRSLPPRAQATCMHNARNVSPRIASILRSLQRHTHTHACTHARTHTHAHTQATRMHNARNVSPTRVASILRSLQRLGHRPDFGFLHNFTQVARYLWTGFTPQVRVCVVCGGGVVCGGVL
jgi:hypothetical protein